MDAALLELDRKWRAKVRQEYYLRREDFPSQREYDDYLEQFEDLVEQLVSETTRAAGLAQLQKLRAACAEQTRRNLGEYTLERKRRDEQIAQEEAERKQAVQERKEAEQRAAELVAQRRAALQQGIRAGTTTVGMARAALSAAVHSAHEQAQASVRASGASGPTGGILPPAHQSSASAPPPPVERLVQPLDAAEAEARKKADEQKEREGMKSSIHAKPEMYEADAELAARVRAAGGYASDQWRYRYLSEALSVQSAFWAAQQT